MKLRWFVLVSLMALLLLVLTVSATLASSTTPTTTTSTTKLLRRCEDNYDDDELAAIAENGDDGYEPDDCPLLAHTLTGPMFLNFCQPGDEDWIKFKAMPNMLYQIRAEPVWNYPTEPHLDLLDDGQVVAQNDHYFSNNAEVWWWNTGGERWIYLRVTELRGRAECGNSAYTMSLHSFEQNPYPATAQPTLTLTPMPTSTPITATVPITTPAATSTPIVITGSIVTPIPTVTATPGS